MMYSPCMEIILYMYCVLQIIHATIGQWKKAITSFMLILTILLPNDYLQIQCAFAANTGLPIIKELCTCIVFSKLHLLCIIC